MKVPLSMICGMPPSILTSSQTYTPVYLSSVSIFRAML